jgi:hypothetical protein
MMILLRAFLSGVCAVIALLIFGCAVALGWKPDVFSTPKKRRRVA